MAVKRHPEPPCRFCTGIQSIPTMCAKHDRELSEAILQRLEQERRRTAAKDEFRKFCCQPVAGWRQ